MDNPMRIKSLHDLETLANRIAKHRTDSAIKRFLQSYVGKNGLVRETQDFPGWVGYYNQGGSVCGGAVFVHRHPDGSLLVANSETGGRRYEITVPA